MKRDLVTVERTGWLELTLDYRSNLRCIGCFACDPSNTDAMDLDEVGRWLNWGRSQGLENLWIGGGEPTLRPDLGKIVRGARRSGYSHILLQTNGMRLAHEPYADAVVKAGVDAVSLNLKTVEPAVHDRLCGRDGAFDLLARAVDVLAERDIALVADVLLTTSTLPRLADTIGHFAAKGVGRFWLWLLSAADAAGDLAVAAEVPAPRTIAPALAAASDVAATHGATLRSLHTPKCWLPWHLRDIAWSAAELDLWVANPGQAVPLRLEDSPLEGGAWLAACNACSARNRCGGPRADTLELHGDSAFFAIPPTVSNAFHYVLHQLPRHTWPPSAPCPVLAAPPEPAPQRTLYVRRGELLQRAETYTGDFDEPAIAAVKTATQQLYLDMSDKDAPTDFAADLRQLRPDPDCDGCPRAESCGRSFLVADEDVFSRDDALVRNRIAELTGDVLDVGAGHGPYVEAIAPLVARGSVRYTALEPDPAAANELRARAPWAEIEVAAAETLALGDASLNHALILRSYNHLERPVPVLKRLLRALRPGGRLLIVDNVAFALVRTARQASRAERGPAAFEHTRNDGASECLAAVREAAVQSGVAIKVLTRADVGPQTSNQWVLELQRRAVDSPP